MVCFETHIRTESTIKCIVPQSKMTHHWDTLLSTSHNMRLSNFFPLSWSSWQHFYISSLYWSLSIVTILNEWCHHFFTKIGNCCHNRWKFDYPSLLSMTNPLPFKLKCALVAKLFVTTQRMVCMVCLPCTLLPHVAPTCMSAYYYSITYNTYVFETPIIFCTSRKCIRSTYSRVYNTKPYN